MELTLPSHRLRMPWPWCRRALQPSATDQHRTAEGMAGAGRWIVGQGEDLVRRVIGGEVIVANQNGLRPCGQRIHAEHIAEIGAEIPNDTEWIPIRQGSALLIGRTSQHLGILQIRLQGEPVGPQRVGPDLSRPGTPGILAVIVVVTPHGERQRDLAVVADAVGGQALAFARASAGSSSAARMAMIAMTTSSSIRVKAEENPASAGLEVSGTVAHESPAIRGRRRSGAPEDCLLRNHHPEERLRRAANDVSGEVKRTAGTEDIARHWSPRP